MGDYLHRVTGFIILDHQGNRLFSKYWDPSLEPRQKQVAFEAKLFHKTSNKTAQADSPIERTSVAEIEQPRPESRGADLKRFLNLTRGLQKEGSGCSESGDILMLDGRAIVFRYTEEVYMYVMGAMEENEVVLFQVLNCFYEALAQLLKNNLEKKTLLENYELMILTTDEIIDDGIILETNPQNVHTEVSPHMCGETDSPMGALHSMAKILKQNL
eukprot:NODE_4683_length_754_cov_87.405104_g4523_i0.p1 GENE.NODE_4683_length_754_cov_87.405104_g4523_i0~~NODE_4683_length_754_cov_87.405104_g4523_i0.p1  ORF type:complete len:238 (+),score=72.57 NODE_4683_length_754_cov_87.405104_g4523_i0:70-714(+)